MFFLSHTLIFSFPECKLNSSFYYICWVAQSDSYGRGRLFPHTEGKTTHTYVCCGWYPLREDLSYLCLDVLISCAHLVFLYRQLKAKFLHQIKIIKIT